MYTDFRCFIRSFITCWPSYPVDITHRILKGYILNWNSFLEYWHKSAVKIHELASSSANIHQYQFNNSFIIMLKHFSLNIYEFFKFLRKMIKLHLASKCAISATALFPISWDLSVEKYEELKSLLIQLIHTCDRNKSLLKFRILTTTFQHPPLFLGHPSHSGDLLLWVGVRRRASCVNIFFSRTTNKFGV